jgi:hypothetical protein
MAALISRLREEKGARLRLSLQDGEMYRFYMTGLQYGNY